MRSVTCGRATTRSRCISRKASTGELPPKLVRLVFSATDEIVVRVNSRTVHMSSGLVFHAYDDFLLRRRRGDICAGSEYFKHVADARRRGVAP